MEAKLEHENDNAVGLVCRAPDQPSATGVVVPTEKREPALCTRRSVPTENAATSLAAANRHRGYPFNVQPARYLRLSNSFASGQSVTFPAAPVNEIVMFSPSPLVLLGRTEGKLGHLECPI
jgi:hypothetical protein